MTINLVDIIGGQAPAAQRPFQAMFASPGAAGSFASLLSAEQTSAFEAVLGQAQALADELRQPVSIAVDGTFSVVSKAETPQDGALLLIPRNESREPVEPGPLALPAVPGGLDPEAMTPPELAVESGIGDDASEADEAEDGTPLEKASGPPAHRAQPEVDLPQAALTHALHSNGAPFVRFQPVEPIPPVESAPADDGLDVVPEAALTPEDDAAEPLSGPIVATGEETVVLNPEVVVNAVVVQMNPEAELFPNVEAETPTVTLAAAVESETSVVAQTPSPKASEQAVSRLQEVLKPQTAQTRNPVFQRGAAPPTNTAEPVAAPVNVPVTEAPDISGDTAVPRPVTTAAVVKPPLSGTVQPAIVLDVEGDASVVAQTPSPKASEQAVSRLQAVLKPQTAQTRNPVFQRGAAPPTNTAEPVAAPVNVPVNEPPLSGTTQPAIVLDSESEAGVVAQAPSPKAVEEAVSRLQNVLKPQVAQARNPVVRMAGEAGSEPVQAGSKPSPVKPERVEKPPATLPEVSHKAARAEAISRRMATEAVAHSVKGADTRAEVPKAEPAKVFVEPETVASPPSTERASLLAAAVRADSDEPKLAPASPAANAKTASGAKVNRSDHAAQVLAALEEGSSPSAEAKPLAPAPAPAETAAKAARASDGLNLAVTPEPSVSSLGNAQPGQVQAQAEPVPVMPGETAQPVAPAEVARSSQAEVKAPAFQDRPVVTVSNVGEYTVRTVRHMMGSGEQTIRVRLAPESLGELHITVKSTGDTLEIVLASSDRGVRQVLEQQLHVLRDALTREGIDVSKAIVTTAPSGGESDGQNTASARTGNGQGGTPGQPARNQSGGAPSHAREHPVFKQNTHPGEANQGRLNVFV